VAITRHISRLTESPVQCYETFSVQTCRPSTQLLELQMCGRFTATFEFSDIRVRWNLDRELPKYTPRFNIAPEQVSATIPVIIRHKGGNECRLMHWG
jgi:SOS response associated peptidase (SRAP)